MSKYIIYHLKFKKIDSKSFFTEGEGFNEIREKLDEGLKSKELILSKMEKNGEMTPIPNQIIRSADQVTVMNVCNVVLLKRWKDYKEVREESNPFCQVIIDNRGDFPQVAIERCKAFEYDCDKVQKILQDYFSKFLSPFGYNAVILKKSKSGEFWDIVERQLLEKHDSVKKISFVVQNPQQCGPLIASQIMTDRIKTLCELAGDLGGNGCEYSVNSPSSECLNRNTLNEDLNNMVKLCLRNGYNLMVDFQKMGMFRVSDRICAMYELGKEELAEFLTGQTNIVCYKLFEWLDIINKETLEYDEELQAPKRGQKNNQQKVS